MENLKIKIDQAHTLKRRLKNMFNSVEKTVERIPHAPSFDYMVDIIKQILIHEGLEDEIEVKPAKGAKYIFLVEKSSDVVVANVNYITK